RYPDLLKQPRSRSITDQKLTTISLPDDLGTSSEILDLTSSIKAAQTISGEIVLDKLLASLMTIVIENAGAQRGLLILERAGHWLIEAEGQIESGHVNVLQAASVEEAGQNLQLSVGIINFVASTQTHVVLDNATQSGAFTQDPYIQASQAQSLLCMPLINQAKLMGMLYLENNLTVGAFTPDRIQVLQLLSSQIAISIENARFYAHLEELVDVRTKALEAAQKTADEAREVAEQANRAKSRFLANMSHELRTPLNGILGYTQILQQHQSLSNAQAEGLGVIQQSGEHLLSLINEILDLAKIEAGHTTLNLTEFDLSVMLNNIVNVFVIRAKQKGLTFSFHLDPELPVGVKSDEIRLRQILINLLGNAIKFTEQGEINLRVMRYQSRVRFEVEDTGMGISPANLKTVFEPFQQVSQLHQQIEGTGLGLSITKQLVELLGGELQVKSQLDTGTVFWFDIELPAVSDWIETVSTSAPSIVGINGAKRTILIVDDQQTNRDILIKLLTPLNVYIQEAASGQEAIEKAKKYHPDLILMDIVMPEVDGIAATQQIRRMSTINDIPIIAVSAGAFSEDQQRSRQAGCNGFVAKPVRREALFQQIQTCLDWVWEYENQAKMAEGQPVDSNESDDPSLSPLPPDQMALLLKLAKQGNIKQIRTKLDEFEQLDDQYQPFVTELRQLARRYRVKQIRDVLEAYSD
ncbi:MAG: ATP-binding protein, partial [Chloroflexota bacterium]